MIEIRNDGRTYNQVRPINIQIDVFGYADVSVLFEQGGTKVLVGVTLQDGVPFFLKGSNSGWLTAEYALLPISTRGRSQRDSRQSNPSSRSLEISRLIGRCLRSGVDLSAIGERTIMVDCDVLQADGGTRCACISAASLALKIAVNRWMSEGAIRRQFVLESIAGISVGIVNGSACLDLSESEDNETDADFNFVLTRSGNIVEIQGTSEKSPISWENFAGLRNFALHGVEEVFKACDQITISLTESPESPKKPLFSLANRVQPK